LRVALAQALLSQGKIDEAKTQIGEALRASPGDADAAAVLAASEKIAAERAASVVAVPPPISPVDQAVAEAYQSKDREQFARAAELLETWLRAHPDDLEKRKTLAFTYLDKLHDPRAAVPHLQLVVAALPGDADWRWLLARGVREANPPQPRPPSPLAAAIAAAYQSKEPGKFAHAAVLLENHLRKQPGDLAMRKTLAFTYLDKLHEPQRAVPHLQAVVAALPRDAGWRQLLAQACEGAGDLESAARAWREAAALSPRDAWARYHLGCSLNRLHRASEAESVFREALAIDPANSYVRLELAHLLLASGRSREARAIAADIARHDSKNADAHTLLGDDDRANFSFAAARREYAAALAAQPDFAAAQAGLDEIRRQQRPQAKLVYYTFHDTDDLRTTGYYSYFTPFTNGPLQLSAFANDLTFQQSYAPGDLLRAGVPRENIERVETGVDAVWRFSRWLQVSVGESQFKVPAHVTHGGVSTAIYVEPARFVDFSIGYRTGAPVNDGYVTARDAFTQSVLSASLNLRPTRALSASVTANTADYSDGNTRRYFLASLAYDLFPKAGLTAKLEYQWLDYRVHTSAYSSSQNYGIARPVLECNPQLTRWLKLQLHGELDYVENVQQWGTGFTAGVRVMRGDALELGFGYMNYRIPGGQTNWSGDGWKMDLSCRF
jgi:predicted Zn-dependent protease